MAGDSIAASRGLPELTQNLITLSHGHSTPSLKISCKLVQPFSRNIADNETNKDTNRSKTIPSPPTGGGVITLEPRNNQNMAYIKVAIIRVAEM